MHIKATEGNDMLDWINQVGLENAMKLAHRLSMISIAALTFNANHYYNQSPARSESRMTQFFRLFGAMKGDREFYCKLNIDDYIPNQASIAVSSQEKVVDLTYGFGFEDFGEEPIVYSRAVLTLLEEERYDVSDDFQMLLLDIEKSSIGLQAINRLEMIIKRQGKNLPYQLLKYALESCPYLNCFFLSCMKMHEEIWLSPLGYRSDDATIKGDPSSTTERNIKQIRLEGFPPYHQYLDLLSRFVPNTTTIIFADAYRNCLNSNVRDPTEFNFNLTAFPNLKEFHLDIQMVVYINCDITRCFHHLFIHFKYSDGDEAYYDIQENHGLDGAEPTILLQINPIFLCLMINKPYWTVCKTINSRLNSWCLNVTTLMYSLSTFIISCVLLKFILVNFKLLSLEISLIAFSVT